jgi:hypothetical protein
LCPMTGTLLITKRSHARFAAAVNARSANDQKLS